MKNETLVFKTNDYEIELKIKSVIKNAKVETIAKSFNDYTWKEIQTMVKDGNHNFKVGDIKTISFRGKEHEIVIIGLNHGGDNTITCQFRDIVFDSVVNKTATNKGGFAKSGLYNYLNTKFKQELNDTLGIGIESYIFLPSEFEVFGKNEYSKKEGYEKQYDYYKNKRNRIKYDFEIENSVTFWWLRSAHSGNTGNFVCVNYVGGVSGTCACFNRGVSPCFIIYQRKKSRANSTKKVEGENMLENIYDFLRNYTNFIIDEDVNVNLSNFEDVINAIEEIMYEEGLSYIKELVSHLDEKYGDE